MSNAKKIDLMIVGAQKAGTTSLNNYLCEHPEILGHASLQKEFAYFWDDSIFEKGFEAEFDKAFIKNRTTNTAKIVAKNVGISNNEQALKRLQEHNKECKLVFIVREPVSRTYSSYTMEVFNGWMDRDFEDLKEVIINNQTNDSMYKYFIEPSLYANHIKLIYKYFPKDQVRVYSFDEFKSNPEKICGEIFEWLGVSSAYIPSFEKTHNATKQPKSKFFAKLILSMRKKDNIIKKIVKVILPYSMFSKMGSFIMESNKSNKNVEKVSDEMKEFLSNYFEPYNKEFNELTNSSIK
jgi:hypothetical protein